MIMNNVDFETYFKHYPDENGYFGRYGGVFVSDELKKAMAEITEAYYTIKTGDGSLSWRGGQVIAYLGQTYDAETGTVTGTAVSGNPVSYYNGTRWTLGWT